MADMGDQEKVAKDPAPEEAGKEEVVKEEVVKEEGVKEEVKEKDYSDPMSFYFHVNTPEEEEMLKELHDNWVEPEVPDMSEFDELYRALESKDSEHGGEGDKTLGGEPQAEGNLEG